MKHSELPKRVRRSPEALRDIVKQFEHSELSRAAFCRKHALSPVTFERWRQKQTAGEVTQASHPEAAMFVQLIDTDGEQEHRGADARFSTAPVWDVELEIGEAMVLRLRRPC